MLGLLLGTVAFAGAPTRVAAVIEAGSSIMDVEASADGLSVLLSDESGGATLRLDLATWTIADVSPCEQPAGLVAVPGGSHVFWVGCLDGSVASVQFKDGVASGTPVSVPVTEMPIIGLTASESTLYALVESEIDGGIPYVNTVDLSDHTVNSGGGFPAPVGGTGFEDIALSGSGVYISHGGSQITHMDGYSGGAALQQQTVAGASTGDIVVLPGVNLLVSGGDAGVLSFEASTNRLVPLLNEDEGVDEATALGLDLEQGAFFVADEGAGELLRFAASASTGMPYGDVLDSVVLPSGIGQINELAVLEGYVLAGSSTGDLVVLTDRPWLEAERPAPKAALADQEVTIDFVSDVGGSWEARLNTTDNQGGQRIDSGTVSASEVGTARFSVDGDFREGDNQIRIVLTDGSGLKGHDTAVLSVDNPPSRVTLNAGAVGWGDGLVKVRINGIPDEDLSHYTIYVSTEAFSAGEYAEAGPGFVGMAADLSGRRLNLPRKVSAEPGQDKEVTIAPLTNGVTYYVSVRATDAAGQEGQMSKVLSVEPEETFGVADLAGERGGFGCSSTGAGMSFVLALLGLASLSRRTSSLVAALVMVGLSLPAEARSEWPQSGKTWSEIKGQTFELRYGPMSFKDDSITSIFGDEGHNLIMMQFGPTIFDLVELKGSIGYFHGEATRVSASGASSSQDDYLNLYPVAVDLTGRLDIIPEQPVIPFAGVGLDYFFWREIWEGSSGGSRDEISGGKPGWHKTYGAHILLDTFDQRRASKLQAVSGITDSYITVEYRVQEVGEDQSGIKFSAETLSFGLKFDH